MVASDVRVVMELFLSWMERVYLNRVRPGIVGVSLFMGGEPTSSRAVVQSAGFGLRLKAQIMKDDFPRAGPVLHLLLRYTQALISTVLDRAALERRSCECYAVVKKEYDRLLPVKSAAYL